MRYSDAAYAFLVALAVSVALTPLAARLARRTGAMAWPSDRGLAERATPLLGGLAILAGVLIAAAFWLPPQIALSGPSPHSTAPVGHVATWWVLGGAALIALVGAIDDVRELRPLVKLIGQVAAAVLAVSPGHAVITSVSVPFLGSLQFPHAGGVLSVLWLVALMNIVNFSDGVDGLAAGVCAIDGVAFAIIAFSLEPASNAAVLAAVTAGAAIGFLVHNFPPAWVFMGDTGANLLGYLLGVAAVIGSIKTGAVLALVVPLLILAVPFLDTGFVIAKRLKYGHAPWHRDTEHFHHRMKRIGFSPRKTIAYLYTWSILLAGLAVAMRFITGGRHHLSSIPVGWLIFLIGLIVVCVAASIYLIYVLQILKFKIQIRRISPAAREADIDAAVEQGIQTGEFAVIPPETGEFEMIPK
jgi:UDP-GlcNAc:undecaprenyl-phosphate GlcNAc-1-phosphate transferase